MYTRQFDQAGFKAKLSCYYSSLRIKPFSMQIKLSSCLEKKAVVARIVCTSLETSQIITQSKHIQRMTWEVDETRIFCRKLRFPRYLYVLYMIYVYIHIYTLGNPIILSWCFVLRPYSSNALTRFSLRSFFTRPHQQIFWNPVVAQQQMTGHACQRHC